MRVVIYVRVSLPYVKGKATLTEEEIKKLQKQDVDNQLFPLREFVANKKWELVKEYIDYSSGKSTDKRTSFQQLMKDAFLAKFDCVVVWKLDRFARSMQDFVATIKELDRLKIRFIATSQNIDTDNASPVGKLMMHIMAAFAEFERELIVDRIKQSLATRKAKGLPLGRARVIVDKSKIEGMIKDGLSVREISKRLKVSRMTIKRRLGEER